MNTKPEHPGPTVVSEKPYKFCPPRNSRFWPWLSRLTTKPYLRRSFGVESSEVIGAERIAASLKAGHGVLIVPNHPRPADPPSLGLLSQALHQNLNVMASAHLFLQSRAFAWLLPRIGAFPVYREGMDRESLKMAIQILGSASRPLVIFAEGVISRSNDRLNHLQDGVAFIARSAAKQRAEAVPGGKVVVHPLALRYTFHGDLEKSLAPVLDKIERRLSWQPQRSLALRDRVIKLGHALLALKEIEYFGGPQTGASIPERTERLMNGVLEPLEREWLKGRAEGTVVNRVKNLRKVILPDLISGDIADVERVRRWNQLFDLEVAQQIFHFPADYLGDNPPPERLIETVERFEEALGVANPSVHRPMHLRMEAGEAIEVDPQRDKKAVSDPLMDAIRASLTTMLGIPVKEDQPRPTP